MKPKKDQSPLQAPWNEDLTTPAQENCTSAVDQDRCGPAPPSLNGGGLLTSSFSGPGCVTSKEDVTQDSESRGTCLGKTFFFFPLGQG